jgi:hypothetical protein
VFDILLCSFQCLLHGIFIRGGVNGGESTKKIVLIVHELF